MKTVCLIQARETSTRFPGKIHVDLGGKRVLEWVTEAASKIEGVDKVRVIQPCDAPLRDENDVLGRYTDAAREEKADTVIRVTGDCPFFDPKIGTLCLWYYNHWGYEYVSNVWPKRTWPDGLDCEVFTAKSLFVADERATYSGDREHVTPYIQRHARTWYNLSLPVDWSWVRLTLDTPEDLVWLRHALNAPKSSFAAPSK